MSLHVLPLEDLWSCSVPGLRRQSWVSLSGHSQLLRAGMWPSPGNESRKPVSCVHSVTLSLVPRQRGGGNRFKFSGDKNWTGGKGYGRGLHLCCRVGQAWSSLSGPVAAHLNYLPAWCLSTLLTCLHATLGLLPGAILSTFQEKLPGTIKTLLG